MGHRRVKVRIWFLFYNANGFLAKEKTTTKSTGVGNINYNLGLTNSHCTLTGRSVSEGTRYGGSRVLICHFILLTSENLSFYAIFNTFGKNYFPPKRRFTGREQKNQKRKVSLRRLSFFCVNP